MRGWWACCGAARMVLCCVCNAGFALGTGCIMHAVRCTAMVRRGRIVGGSNRAGRMIATSGGQTFLHAAAHPWWCVHVLCTLLT